MEQREAQGLLVALRIGTGNAERGPYFRPLRGNGGLPLEPLLQPTCRQLHYYILTQ